MGNIDIDAASRNRVYILVTVMALTGQVSTAACASTIFSSPKVPVDLPLAVPSITWDLPSESLSKWAGSKP